MKVYVIHPDQQPVSALLANEVLKSLPADAEVSAASQADVTDADLILAVFSLRQGAFAPTVACFRELRDKKVAFLAALAGQVDQGRLRKTVWGIKKSFCGNHVLGGYLCPLDDRATAARVEDNEIMKAREFARKILEAQTSAGSASLREASA
jgi:hypothetical protein